MRISSILRRMAEFKRMYQLASLIDEKNTEKANDYIHIALTKEKHMQHLMFVERDDALAAFCQKSGLDEHEADKILEAAMSYKYVEELPAKLPYQQDRLRVTPKEGRDLLYKKGWVKIGLVNEVLSHFRTTATIVVTVVVAVVLSNIVDIVKFTAKIF